MNEKDVAFRVYDSPRARYAPLSRERGKTPKGGLG
jgi:hypothetical protein